MYHTVHYTAADLQELRSLYKVTQAQLAEAIGVRQATVADWERGATHPSSLACAAIETFVWKRRAAGESDLVMKERERFLGHLDALPDLIAAKLEGNLDLPRWTRAQLAAEIRQILADSP